MLATLVVVVSSLTVFVKRDALDTDQWTNASGEVLEDPAVQNALAVYLVNQLYTRVDVAAEIQAQLPDQAAPLAAPLAAAVQEVTLRAARALLARPETIQLWKDANRLAHTELLAVLDGDTERLSTTNGQVVLDLRPILEKLGDSALGQRLPSRSPTGRRADRDPQVGSAEDGADERPRPCARYRSCSPCIALALYAGAVWLSPSRRRMLFWVGISAILSGVLVLVARRVAGDYLADALTGDVPTAKPAALAVWTIMTELLRNIGFNLVAYGIGIMLAALLAGPTRAATTIRRWLAPTLEERPVAAFGVVVGLFMLLLLFGPTDAQRLVPLGLLCGFALIGVEALRRQTRREFPAAQRLAQSGIASTQAATAACTVGIEPLRADHLGHPCERELPLHPRPEAGHDERDPIASRGPSSAPPAPRDRSSRNA